jgi:hypothetical protein
VTKSILKSRTHLVIPDTQAKPGAPTDHLGWIGEYIVERQPDVVVHLGDHADMPSLSSYDKGKIQFEGRRYINDIDAANSAFDILNKPLGTHNARLAKNKKTQWWPERHILLGNHENRINIAIENSSQLDGTIGIDKDLNYQAHGWTQHDFLRPIDIDGVFYTHYWYQPNNGRPFSGTIENRLKNIGHTFTQGHLQTLMYGLRFVAGKSQHGLVAGACYLHSEEYKGHQGNAHWRGIIVKHEVSEGSYDPMFVSLDYLCRRYEGQTLERFVGKKYNFDVYGQDIISK